MGQDKSSEISYIEDVRKNIISKLTDKPDENIIIILKGIRKIFDSTLSIYNKFNDDYTKLITYSNRLEKFEARPDSAEGHICTDIVLKDIIKTTYIKDLYQTDYLYTDKAVKEFRLRTYIGVPVKINSKVLGVLSIVFDEIVENKTIMEKLLKNMARLIAVEEQHMMILKNEQKLIYKYQLFYDTINVGIFTVKGNIITEANKHLCSLFKMNKDEIIGKTLIELSPKYQPDENLSSRELMVRLKSVTKKRQVFEWVFKNKNKQSFITQITLTLFSDKNSDEKEIIGFVQDITRYKNHELELIQAREKAERADKLKSIFLANMSHEIRTPMNAILGFTQLLKEPDFPEEKRNEFIDIIYQSGKSLLDLINDIIDISTIEAGQIELKLRKVSLNNINKEVYNLFKLQAAEKGIELILENGLSDEKDFITTDELKVRQVLTNLVGNAMKFTEKGHVKFGYNLIDDKIEYFVEDTGTGIPEKHQPFIFDRFRKFELYNKNKEPHKGTGLGLSISKAFVEYLGGEIYFTSKENRGTTFFFYLPYNTLLKKNKKSKKDMNKEEISKSLEGKKVLVVEDDIYVIKYLELALKPLNLKIVVTNNGEEAVNYVKNDPEITIVLMDLRMPVMGGLEATRLIKQLRPELPVIAQTAFALAGDKEKALEAGCDDYISKPLNRTQLIEIVKKHIL